MIKPTEHQEAALNKIVNWHKNKKPNQQSWVMTGSAGTGKTTLMMSLQNNAINGVVYCAYTGKASDVLVSKDIPASTIHRLIYNVSLSSIHRVYLVIFVLKRWKISV